AAALSFSAWPGRVRAATTSPAGGMPRWHSCRRAGRRCGPGARGPPRRGGFAFSGARFILEPPMAMRCLALAAMLAGCAELGVISDGTSISVGKPSQGYLVEGARLPDRGEGFTTREVWLARDNRYGTDELIDLVIGVARRMHRQVPGVKLVVADLSG